MAVQAVPTKGNLMNTKKSLALAKNGYELLDRKRNILIREMMMLIDHANAIQNKIDSAYAEAYVALQTANIRNGFCDEISSAVPVENGLKLDSRSVMGVEIPILTMDESDNKNYLHYGTRTTNSAVDRAFIMFTKVKELTVELAEIENSVYRLADSIKKTQKRANALKNIMIPRFEETVKFITDALDEKDREEFSRLKVIKRTKLREADEADLSGKTDREKHLVFAVPAAEEKGDDVALVQGIIDLVYEASDGWVVVDYKTDRYSEKEADNKDERAALARSKHAFQLDSYAAAYEASGRKVSKKYLYLVRYGEFVEV